jgi:hypothetical protein
MEPVLPCGRPVSRSAALTSWGPGSFTRCPPHRNCVAARYPRGHRSAFGVCWLPSLDRQPTPPCGVAGYRRCSASVPHLSRETWSSRWRLTQPRYRTSGRRSDPQLASAQLPHRASRKRRGLVAGVVHNVCPAPVRGLVSPDRPREVRLAGIPRRRLSVLTLVAIG